MLDGIIKSGRGALYIAEIGLNHNGSPDMAAAMIEAAAGAGADFVKFQVFVPELLYSVYNDDLLSGGRELHQDRGRIDFFKKFVLRGEEYRMLHSLAGERGVRFFSSVFDAESLELMEEVGISAYKIASSEVTNDALIEAVAETGKPAILSTGMSTDDEIGRAVDQFRRRTGAELVLMHCVSLYPTRPEQANLARVRTLAERFGLPAGFSDHTRGTAAPRIAAAFGARIFEKHFTIDRFYDCPDKDISCTPEEFASLIESVEEAIRMIGTGAISYAPYEAGAARASRRSIYARRRIPAGKTIDEEDLITLRPGVGFPAYMLKSIVGKKARVDIPGDFLIRSEHLSADR
jgi:N,N'-diacetyllegionaminate synthase